MKKLKIRIHIPSCRYDGVSLDEYEEALKQEFDGEFDVVFEGASEGSDVYYQFGHAGLGIANSEANEVGSRVTRVYLSVKNQIRQEQE